MMALSSMRLKMFIAAWRIVAMLAGPLRWSREIGQSVRCTGPIEMEDHDMSKRRRFSADFKARVALEALRGDRTIQEVAARHKVHPNQVNTWKRRAIEGFGDVFSYKRKRAKQDREAEIRDLHAKVGELTVERDPRTPVSHVFGLNTSRG